MTTRQAVAREAMSWMHTPYHHHARIKGVGVDCAQLLCGVFEACNLIPAINTGMYPVDWHMHRSEELFSDWLGKYGIMQPSMSKKQVGDIFLFKFGRTFSHGSILVDENILVHSYVGTGVIMSSFDEEPLLNRRFQHWSIFN